MSNTHSVVRYADDRLAVLPGDYRGLCTDGLRDCFCLGAYATYAEAQAAMRDERLIDVVGEALDQQSDELHGDDLPYDDSEEYDDD